MTVETASTAGRVLRGRIVADELFGLVRPRWGMLLIVVTCIVGSAVAQLIPPLVVRHVVDNNLVPSRTDGLAESGFIYLAAIGLGAGFTFGYSYLAAVVAQSSLADLRVRLFSHVVRLPMTYFDRTTLGDVMSRVTADVETIDELFTGGVVTLIGQLVPLLAVIAAMIALSPLLSLVAAIIAPPLAGLTRYLQVRGRDAQRDKRVAVGQLNTQLAEFVGGVETLRTFAREDVFVGRFRTTLAQTLGASNRSALYNAFFTPLTNLLAAVVVTALIDVGGSSIGASVGLSLGTLTAFVLLFQRFFAPIAALGDEWQSVQAAFAGTERVVDVLRLPVDPDPLPRAGDTGNERLAGIQVDNVTFGYRPGHAVLRSLSLQVRSGEHVAVVGRTGAGKSSLLALLGGLYAPWAGTVRVATKDPRELTESQRREVLGVVPQTVQLFGGTLRENLSLYDAAIPDDAIARAAAVAGLDPLVSSFPDHYDAALAPEGGGRGIVLSTGQRQLVTLARALVSDPAVLLLDEATAAIDSASDGRFRAALRKTAVLGGCAVLTVAHRLSTAREADRVVVLDAGHVVEEGTPHELIAAGGQFAAFMELEAAGWDWDDRESG